MFLIKNTLPFPTGNALLSTKNMAPLSLFDFQQLRNPGPTDVVAAADAVISELELTPPIDTEVVASYLDVSRIEEIELEAAGCLICDGRDVSIQVRASDNFQRQRFTIFHECTHIFFRGFERQTRYRCSPSVIPGRDKDLEAMCDQGASSLLLPERFVRADLLESDFGTATLMDVADTYDASLEASGHRIVDLAPYPTLFLVLEVNRKPSERSKPLAEPKLRVRTARGNGGWPFIPPHKSVTEDSPLGRALLGEVVHERTTLDGLARDPVPSVEVCARLVPRSDRERVLALFRRIP